MGLRQNIDEILKRGENLESVGRKACRQVSVSKRLCGVWLWFVSFWGFN